MDRYEPVGLILLALLDEVRGGLDGADDDDEEDDIAGGIHVLTEMLMDELDYLLAELDRNAFTAVAAKEPAAETAAVSEPVAEAPATRQIV